MSDPSPESTHIALVHETITDWALGDPLAGSNSRNMTYLGSTSRVVEVETTVRTRIVTPPGQVTDG